MSEIFTELAKKFERWILLDNNEIVKDENNKIKEFTSIDEMEYYIDVHYYDGCFFKFFKYYGSFD
jgi:hypothetical protein